LRSTARPKDSDRLATLAVWLDHASRWLEQEVRDSRCAAGLPADDDADPEQRVETVTFLTAELDVAVEGLRRATDVLAALASPLPDPIGPACGSAHTPTPTRRQVHLRLVE
jgi:hypothetical protein